jgi:hypothetical protein
VGGFHGGQDGLGDQLIGREGFAGQDDLGSRQVAALDERRDAAALDVLAQDLGLVSLRQLDVVAAREADPVGGRINKRFEVGDDRQPACDPGGVVPPARDFLMAQRAGRFPVRRYVSAYGWTTQAGRLSELIPLAEPFGFVIEGQFASDP